MKKILIITIIVILLVCACVQTFCYNINDDIVPTNKLNSVNINATNTSDIDVSVDSSRLLSNNDILWQEGYFDTINSVALSEVGNKYENYDYCCEVHRLDANNIGCCDSPTRFSTDKYPHNTPSKVPCTSTTFRLGEVVADRFDYCCDEPVRYNCCYSPYIGQYSQYFNTNSASGNPVASLCDSTCNLLEENTFCPVHHSSMLYEECARAADSSHSIVHKDSSKGYFYKNTKYVTPYFHDWDTGAVLSDFHKIATSTYYDYSGYDSNGCEKYEDMVDLWPLSMKSNYEFVFDFTFSNYSWVPEMPQLVYLNGNPVDGVELIKRYDGPGINSSQKRRIVSLSFQYAKNLNFQNIKFVFPKQCKFKYTVGINDSSKPTNYRNYVGLRALSSYFIANAPADFTANFLNTDYRYNMNCCSAPGIKKFKDCNFYLTDYVDFIGNCGNCGNKYSNLLSSNYKVARYDCTLCNYTCTTSLEIYEHRLIHEKSCVVCKNIYKKSSSSIDDPCASCNNKFLLKLFCADKNCRTIIQNTYQVGKISYDVLNFRDPKFINCQKCSNVYDDYNFMATKCIACKKDYQYNSFFSTVKDYNMSKLDFMGSSPKYFKTTILPENSNITIEFVNRELISTSTYTDRKKNTFVFEKYRSNYKIKSININFTNDFIFNFLDKHKDDSLRLYTSYMNLGFLRINSTDKVVKFNNATDLKNVNYQIDIDYNSSVNGLNKVVPLCQVDFHLSGLTFKSNDQVYSPTKHDFDPIGDSIFWGYETTFNNYSDHNIISYSLSTSPYIPYFLLSNYTRKPLIPEDEVKNIFGISKIENPVAWDLVAHTNNILYWFLNDCPLVSHIVKVLNYSYSFMKLFFDKIGLLGQLGIFGSIILGLLVLCFVKKSTA